MSVLAFALSAPVSAQELGKSNCPATKRDEPTATMMTERTCSPTDDLPRLGNESQQSLGVRLMLLRQDSRRETLGRVAASDGYRALHHDGAVIQFVVHQMNGTARHLDPPIKSLLLYS